MNAHYKKFDGGWDLDCEVNVGGSVKTASLGTISAAQLMLIRDAVRDTNAILKQQTVVLRAISRKLTKPRKRKTK